MVTQLKSITDDPRIKVPSEEYDRIEKAKRYYQDKLPKVKYMSMGHQQQRPLNSINMTKLASQRLASLIFNERCTINVNDDKLQSILDPTFRRNNFYLNCENKLEKWIALGSGAVRPYVDRDEIKFSWADADDVYPLESNTNDVREIALSRKMMKVVNDQAYYYTLIEFHQWKTTPETDEDGNIFYPYVITNELYESEDPDVVGQQVPLQLVDEFAQLSPTSVFHNIKKPLFAFYRNAGANNWSFTSPLGVGLCDNCRNILDDINTTHDGFVWDVQTGYRRITIPRSWVQRQQQINGKPIPKDAQMYWDSKDAVFVPVNSRMDDTSSFKDLAIEIRTDQYTASMQFFLSEFENFLGLSQGTFTNTPTGVQTATEVVTNNSMTYQTRSSYLTMVEKTIDQLVYAIAELLQTPELWSDQKARWDGNIDDLVINVDFNDGVFVDREAQRQSDLQAVQAGVMPKLQFLIRNYQLSEQQAREWLQEVDQEQSPTPPDQELEMFPKEADDDNGDDEETDDGNS